MLYSQEKKIFQEELKNIIFEPMESGFDYIVSKALESEFPEDIIEFSVEVLNDISCFPMCV